LNSRKDDIPLLIEHFGKNIAESQGSEVKKFSEKAIDLMKKYDWSGNVRELRNVIERLIILGDKEISAKNVKDFIKI
jgi:DNA-binding NtrC family response regulator